MNTTAPFVVTEWEWLKLMLRLYSLERRAPMWATVFNFRDENEAVGFQNTDAWIICRIYNHSMDEILEDVKSKEDLLEKYVEGWIKLERKALLQIITRLPMLSKEINLDKDVLFQIMWDHGMGGLDHMQDRRQKRNVGSFA